MTSFRRILFCLGATALCCVGMQAQPAANTGAPAAIRSPIAVFRELLAMNPQERKQVIASRAPEVQQRILQKLGEYEMLPGPLREQRLRETELRWYLRPLMNEPRTNRAARLALIPEDERQIVEQRLQMWDLVPPPLQEQWMNDDMVVNYLAQTTSATPEETNAILAMIPPEQRSKLQAGLDRWNHMSDGERQRALAGFKQFFVLTAEEKEKTLDTIPDAERQQMEETLAAYGKLTPSQRSQCIRSFEKFATMSLVERQQFLKNAERWQEMTPEERQKWRDLVHVAPIMPPGENPSPPALPSSTYRLAPPRALATN